MNSNNNIQHVYGYGEEKIRDYGQQSMKVSKGKTLFLLIRLCKCLIFSDAWLIEVRC